MYSFPLSTCVIISRMTLPPFSHKCLQSVGTVLAEEESPTLPDRTCSFPSGHCDGAAVLSLSPGPLRDPRPRAVSVCLLSPGFCCAEGATPRAGLSSHRGFSPSSGNGALWAQSVLCLIQTANGGSQSCVRSKIPSCSENWDGSRMVWNMWT